MRLHHEAQEHRIPAVSVGKSVGNEQKKLYLVRNRRKSQLQRVLFAGGGTGGHVFMSIALASALREADPSVELLFVGTSQGLEMRVIPKRGYHLETIQIGGINRVGILPALKSILQIPASIFRSALLVRKFKPSVVVGVGGYSSGPVLIASRLLGYPGLLIEPNAYPGLTNRLLARWVDRAVVSFEETERWFGSRARRTGIPVRNDFYDVAPADYTVSTLNLLVFGGSQGSQAINRMMCEALPHLTDLPLRIVHQTGRADYEKVQRCYALTNLQSEVLEFIDDMPAYFQDSHLILCRAGALTIAELTAAGRPSILVPFPQAADDHQRKNAQALEREGAAIALDQETTSGATLAERIRTLLNSRHDLAQMAAAARSLARPGSSEEIICLMEELA